MYEIQLNMRKPSHDKGAKDDQRYFWLASKRASINSIKHMHILLTVQLRRIDQSLAAG